MSQHLVMLSALLSLTAVPALANDNPVIETRPQRAEVLAAASGLPAVSWACRAEATLPETDDSNVRWRWQAYQQLDCIAQAAERALEAMDDGEEGTITLTRDDVEEIRTRAIWAKDAAARIGR